MAGSANTTMAADTGITRSAIRSSVHRIEPASVSTLPEAASFDISGSIAVCSGCASTAYGARKNTNATWYATTPPATPLPATLAAPSNKAAPALSIAPHTACRAKVASAGSPRRSTGRTVNPDCRAAKTRMPTKAMTPPVPANASSAFSGTVSSKVGSGPASTRKAMKQPIMTMLLPIGAAAVIEKRRTA